MSAFYTHTQRIDFLTKAVEVIEFCITRIESAIHFQDNHLTRTRTSIDFGESTINNAYLKSLDTLIGTHLVSLFSLAATNIDSWTASINKDMMFNPRSWLGTQITGSVILTALFDSFVAIFDVFSVNDVIKISNAKDERNNGFYTVSVVTGLQLVVTPSMLGTNSPNDETMIITLVER